MFEKIVLNKHLEYKSLRIKRKRVKSIDVEIFSAGKIGLKLKYANEMRKKYAARTFLNAVTLNSWKC